MALQDEWRPQRHPHTASRMVAGEVVIVDTDHNVVRMLNSVGSRVWELADGTRTVAQIVKVLVSEYDVDFATAQERVVAFIEELQEKGLLTSA